MSVRITPAHAGTTLRPRPRSGSNQDHPRSRGDYGIITGKVSRIVGSPPLTRGLLKKAHFLLKNRGITPAHAGTTFKACPPHG